ncbi:probable pectinesterase 53 [Selaginella moellendorffii]|nr:probable pectinesterase 53 [Selaginella moellendorffii]|eukprot:XP_002979836.2 probable pectinesterase 53 [Selaginella moellendorffii]
MTRASRKTKQLVVGVVLSAVAWLLLHVFVLLRSHTAPRIYGAAMAMCVFQSLFSPEPASLTLPFTLDITSSCDDREASPVVFIVDQKGFGDFRTVQDAIDAVPDYNQVPVHIYINNGTFTEKVLIPHSKPYITLQGQGMDLTAIAWNDTANSSGRTYKSASVSVEATDFVAKNLSFLNTSPGPGVGVQGAQAVALRVSSDRAAFYGCGFYGFQDTLFDDQGRHYFKECFIEGSIDFICGSGRSLYENCELHSVANPSKKVSGSITAQRRLKWSEASAFSFVNCSITGTGNVLLGRAWGPFSRVIFAYTSMDSIVHPVGWDDWGDSGRTLTVVYGEYECSGLGSNRRKRANWSHSLSDWQAYPYLSPLFIDGDEWIPELMASSEKKISAATTQELGVLNYEHDDNDEL